MPARAYWQGHIRLALVSIPVQVFPATKSAARISFNQIHKPSGKRIRYEKVVPGVGAVDADDIVKGYEVEKGQYVLLSDEEIDNVKLEAKRTIDLVQFVGADEIDPIYFDKPYLVGPRRTRPAAEAYVVLRDALRETRRSGSASSSSAARQPRGAETLRQGADDRDAPLRRRDPEGRPVFQGDPGREAGQGARRLAEELIERKTTPFDPKAFKDHYEAALRELIDAKIENRPPEAIEEPQIGAKVIDLMDALKRSVGGTAVEPTTRKAAAAPRSRRRRRRPRRRQDQPRRRRRRKRAA